MILASAVAHDAPPLSAAPAHTVIETVDTTSLVSSKESARLLVSFKEMLK